MNKEGKGSVKEINEEYMNQFSGRDSEARFVDKIDYKDNVSSNEYDEVAEDLGEIYTRGNGDDAYWQEDETKRASKDRDGKTVNNTAFVFQQFGSDNKQIIGNIETLVINNKQGGS